MQPLGLCASLRGRIGNKTFDETRAMCVVFRRLTTLKNDAVALGITYRYFNSAHAQQVYFVYRLTVCCASKIQQRKQGIYGLS